MQKKKLKYNQPLARLPFNHNKWNGRKTNKMEKKIRNFPEQSRTIESSVWKKEEIWQLQKKTLNFPRKNRKMSWWRTFVTVSLLFVQVCACVCVPLCSFNEYGANNVDAIRTYAFIITFKLNFSKFSAILPLLSKTKRSLAPWYILVWKWFFLFLAREKNFFVNNRKLS